MRVSFNITGRTVVFLRMTYSILVTHSTLEGHENLVKFYFSIFSRVWNNTNGKTLIFIIWVKPILFFRCIDFDEGKTILTEKTT